MSAFTIHSRSLQLEGVSPLAFNLLCALLSLVIMSLLLASILVLMKRYRASSKLDTPLPIYEKQPIPLMRPHHRRTPSTYSIPQSTRYSKSSTLFSCEEHNEPSNNTSIPLPSPLPEIRVTMPDEVDLAGRRHSGRILLVRIGENSEGLEPLNEKPTYYQEKMLDPFPLLDA